MKRIIWLIPLLLLFVVNAYAENPRAEIYLDNSPLSGSNPLPISDADLSDTIQQDSAAINPYTETTKTYTNVKKIEISNPALDVRLGFNDISTADTDNYWIIPETSPTYIRDGLNIPSLDINLMGDEVADDTGTVRIIIWQ